MNILLLSAGGPACHGVIKSLKDINFDGKVVSVDCNELSAGFHLSDSYYIVPTAFDENYITELLKIVSKEKIDVILPTSSNEIISITKNLDKFNGVKLFMSDYESIVNCSDKLKFYEKCKDSFPLPKTSLDSSDIQFPLFAKPRRHSAGSRGVSVCKNIHDVKCSDKNNLEYIYQEYLPGMEYTIDVLLDDQSNPLVAVPRKRLQTKEGISTKAEIVKDDYIEKMCFDICKFLKLKGSICLQMKEDVNGKLKFVEINPRFGGGTYFSTLAGVNFMEIILDLLNKKTIKVNSPNLIKIMRYYNEVVI